MKLHQMTDVVAFGKTWKDSGCHVVQHWSAWESKASTFFDVDQHDQDALHGVMQVVQAVCFASFEDVKRVVRESTPRVLTYCSILLNHIPQFEVVLVAEARFRARELANDWSLQMDAAGRLVVRSEFKAIKMESEH